MNTCHLIQGETASDFVIFGSEAPIILLETEIYEQIIGKIEIFKQFAGQNDDVLYVITRGEPVLVVNNLADEIIEQIVEEQHIVIARDESLSRVSELYDEVEYAYYMQRYEGQIQVAIVLRIIYEDEIAAYFTIYEEDNRG